MALCEGVRSRLAFQTQGWIEELNASEVIITSDVGTVRTITGNVCLPSHLVGDNSKSNRIIMLQSPEASVPASIILHDTLSHSNPNEKGD